MDSPVATGQERGLGPAGVELSAFPDEMLQIAVDAINAHFPSLEIWKHPSIGVRAHEGGQRNSARGSRIQSADGQGACPASHFGR